MQELQLAAARILSDTARARENAASGPRLGFMGRIKGPAGSNEALLSPEAPPKNVETFHNTGTFDILDASLHGCVTTFYPAFTRHFYVCIPIMTTSLDSRAHWS